MRNFKLLYRCIFLITAMSGFFLVTVPTFAQQEDSVATALEEGNKPVRQPFESTWLIDNQTTVVPRKGTLEFMIQHRFGTIYNGIKDMYGLYGSGANIRLGLNYTLFENLGFGSLKGDLSIGFGSTKNGMIQDFNLKYGFLQQTRSGRVPVSITYYGNVAIETQYKTEDLPNGNGSDRLSYFNQIIISRRFSPALSVQVAPSISHYNVVEPTMNNDHIAVAVGGRYKFSPQSAILINYDQPITEHQDGNPQFNVSAGIEIATSAHAFQVFISNYPYIVQQKNNMFNQPNSAHEWYQDLFIGFNITRLWSF
ncbi:MAG TPA: DUF5777 family beta-barrel protein [Bacteroidia bacterium]|nr:DUF5777 family beta-barrel protein [Bacteroidia bacterium]